jgi:hypothetical protein
VVLLEASERLGGQLHLAAQAPETRELPEIDQLPLAATAEARRRGAGSAARAASTVAERLTLTVVVATGSRPAPDGLPGAPGSLVHVADVVTARAAWATASWWWIRTATCEVGVADLLAGRAARSPS